MFSMLLRIIFFLTSTDECGMVSLDVDTITLKIIGGEETVKGQYPFVAALFELKDSEKRFFCGGTLISTNHVLTGTVK